MCQLIKIYFKAEQFVLLLFTQGLAFNSISQHEFPSENSMCLPETGCTNRSSLAKSATDFNPYCFESAIEDSEPYFMSPRSGCPACDICTRI